VPSLYDSVVAGATKLKLCGLLLPGLANTGDCPTDEVAALANCTATADT